MINHIIKNGLKTFEERKDVRKNFNEILPIADCKTEDCDFRASICNISASGAFIKTGTNLAEGQEIAMTFTFPVTMNTMMATGEVVRTSNEGAGVKFKIFFKK